jgi:hypothetical protein
MHKKALNDNKIIYYIIWDLNLPVTFGYIVFAKKKYQFEDRHVLLLKPVDTNIRFF